MAALRPQLPRPVWARLFADRYMRMADAGAVDPSRAGELAESLPAQTVPSALQGVKTLCNAWVASRRMGRLPRACVLGRMARYVACHDLLSAESQCGEVATAQFRLLGPGPPQWRTTATAAEVDSRLAHELSADAVATEAIEAGGPERLRDKPRRIGRPSAELLLRARARS